MEKKAPIYLTAVLGSGKDNEFILGKTKDDIIFTADFMRVEIISSLNEDYAKTLRLKQILN